MKTIKFYLKQRQLVKDKTIIAKAKNYLKKARDNLETMDILYRLNNGTTKKSLRLSKDYNSYEWVVIVGYYAMYTSARALLAKAGFRSKNHTATIAILDKYFVKNKLLDENSFLLLKNALFQKEELEKLSGAKHKREIAQYSITKQTTKNIAERIKKDAYDFVNKVEEILNDTKS